MNPIVDKFFLSVTQLRVRDLLDGDIEYLISSWILASLVSPPDGFYLRETLNERMDSLGREVA